MSTEIHENCYIVNEGTRMTLDGIYIEPYYHFTRIVWTGKAPIGCTYTTPDGSKLPLWWTVFNYINVTEL